MERIEHGIDKLLVAISMDIFGWSTFFPISTPKNCDFWKTRIQMGFCARCFSSTPVYFVGGI